MKRFILSIIFISICSIGFSQTEQTDSIKPKKPLKQKQSKNKGSDKNKDMKVKHTVHDTLIIENNKPDSTAKKEEQ